ncbi:MAG: TerB family tellurite resistance protein [Lutibacter sp.]|nr:TerB family tellurite resistance protein [Lutibacter sp.]
MSISDLYQNRLHEQNKGHFASIVKLAMHDARINDAEFKLLERLANKLDITKSEFDAILKNPSNFEAISPDSYDERLERLYDLTKMLFLDKNPTIDKTTTMDKIALGLGFPVENVRQIVKEAIKFFLKEPDVEDFKQVIKKVNPIKHES